MAAAGQFSAMLVCARRHRLFPPAGPMQQCRRACAGGDKGPVKKTLPKSSRKGFANPAKLYMSTTLKKQVVGMSRWAFGLVS